MCWSRSYEVLNSPPHLPHWYVHGSDTSAMAKAAHGTSFSVDRWPPSAARSRLVSLIRSSEAVARGRRGGVGVAPLASVEVSPARRPWPSATSGLSVFTGHRRGFVRRSIANVSNSRSARDPLTPSAPRAIYFPPFRVYAKSDNDFLSVWWARVAAASPSAG